MTTCHPCCCFRHSTRKAIRMTALIQFAKGFVTIMVGVSLLLESQLDSFAHPEYMQDEASTSTWTSTPDSKFVPFISSKELRELALPLPVVLLSLMSVGLGVYLWFIAATRTDAKCRRWRLFTTVETLALGMCSIFYIATGEFEDADIKYLPIYLAEIAFNCYLIMTVSSFIGIISRPPSINSFEMH